MTYSVPIHGPATSGSAEAIRKFRTVRKGLTDSSSKVRLSVMLSLYKLVKADPFLKAQLVRDLQPLRTDDDSAVQKVAERILANLGA